MNDIDFYRGFIVTKNKAAAQSFKDTSLPTRDDVSKENEYAGVIRSDCCIVDFDNEEHSKKALTIMNESNINFIALETSRGLHFLFKVPPENDDLKNGTHISLACGLEADIKRGPNAYEILKYNGIERKFIHDAAKVPTLPFFFLPINSKETINLLDLRDGDGRNDILYRYEIMCFNAGLSYEQINVLYKRIINRHILHDPLSEKELEMILREDALKGALEKSLMNKSQPNIQGIANLLIKQNNVILLNNKVCIYTDNGSYSSDKADIERAMLYYVPTLKINARKEIYELLRLLAPVKQYSDKRYILFSNCIYDIDSCQVLEHSPAYIIPNQIPHKYNENAQGDDVKAALDTWSCGDEEIKQLLKEIIGYSLYRENNLKKFFIIVGNTHNGKSKFLKLLSIMLGQENISTVSLEDIEKRFVNATLYEKLVNIGDDIESQRITNTAILKKLVSGDALTVEHKGRDPITMVPRAKLIFSANKIPYIKDDTGAIKNRLIIIPFNAHFDNPNTPADPNIIDKLSSEDNIEKLIQIGLDGLCDLLDNQSFTIPAAVTDAQQKHLISHDPILAFINENKDNIIGRPNNDVYRDFCSFCNRYDIQEAKGKITQNIFTRRIKDYFNCTCESNGKKQRIYKLKKCV